MRSLNIANEKKRDAVVGFESSTHKKNISFVLKDGTPKKNIKILKATLGVTEESLLQQYRSLVDLADAIIQGDPEVDVEKTGKVVRSTKKLYLNQENKIAYRVNLVEVVKNLDGTEKERRALEKAQSNILGEIPLQWTGRKVPKEQAIRKFVFSKKYQIKHVNGLTYDFLFDMAKTLHETNTLMLIGSGKKGTDPIVLTAGGVPYRGFLEGRVEDQKYCLILHLTNLELKGVLA